MERNVEPNGIPLVNALRVSKHTYEETMQLSDAHNSAESFIQANALNKLDVIGKQVCIIAVNTRHGLGYFKIN